MNTTPQTENIGGITNPGAFGVDATYKNAMPPLEYSNGVIPQDTIADLTAVFTEINNVFSQAGITPSAADLTQLKQAILKSADQKLASYIDTLSISEGQIQFTNPQDPADKKLYVPIIGDTTQLTTTDKTSLTAAINEVKQAVDNNYSKIRTSAPSTPEAGDIWLEYVV